MSTTTQPGLMHAPPGAVLGGKYRVERELGKGGMGVVLLAHHEALDQHVAIKLLAPQLAENAELVVRFQREARAAAKLHSDHVVRVSDVGTWDKVGPYMVMEYLEGTDLGSLLEKRGSLPVPEAVDYVLEALDAIAEAHAVGIVHRDLKPTNLFLATRSDGGRVIKVLDFGVSKMEVSSEPPSKLTSTRAVMGSPAYMSPEQLKSAKTVDGRADIWSLGVVLFELLTGVLPFDGETVGELFANIIETPPKSVRERRPDIPELLDGVLRRCMRRNPSERYRNVGELAQALAPFGSGRAVKEVERAVAFMGRMPAPSSPAMLVTRPGALSPPSAAKARVAAPANIAAPAVSVAAPVESVVAPAAPTPPTKGTQGAWGTNAGTGAAPRSRAWVGLVAAVVVVLVAGMALRAIVSRLGAPKPTGVTESAVAAVPPPEEAPAPVVPATGTEPAVAEPPAAAPSPPQAAAPQDTVRDAGAKPTGKAKKTGDSINLDQRH